MKGKHHSKLLKDICDFLSGDLDSPPCSSIKEHLEKCKNCEIYVDKLKKTVALYRKLSMDTKVPDRVNRELFAKIYFSKDKDKGREK